MNMQILPIYKREQKMNFKIKYKCHIPISVDSLHHFIFFIMLSLYHYNFFYTIIDAVVCYVRGLWFIILSFQ